MNSAIDVPARDSRAIESIDLSVDGNNQLHRAKFSIDVSTRIGSTGGDFASHVMQYYRERNCCVIDEEPRPVGMSDASARRFGYGLHSARHGNIGTVRQLCQLVGEALGHFKPADAVWQKGDRYYDAMRPTVEPFGLSTPELVADHRAHHLGKLKLVLESSDVLHISLDATDAWEHVPSGTVYPVAPGAVAGALDPAIHRFRCFTFQEIYDDLIRLFALCKTVAPAVRFLLTVSPRPLVEISGAECPLCATGYSKAVLRAVAGQLYRERADVDYLPVYELATIAQQDIVTIDDLLQGEVRGTARNAASADMEQISDNNPSANGSQSEFDDDAELERMLGGDSLCEEILDETFKP